MSVLYFHDLPVYRLDSDQYNAEFERYLATAQRRVGAHVTAEMVGKSFGGSWLFNEIIGYIRLHLLGAQVRGEYYAVSKKRIVRSRSRTIEFQAWKLAPEIDIASPHGSDEVLTAIDDYIQACRKELPQRYIDTSMLVAVSRYVNWGDLAAAAVRGVGGLSK